METSTTKTDTSLFETNQTIAQRASKALDSLDGLKLSFADLMQKASGRVDSTLTTITGKGGIANINGASDERRPVERDNSYHSDDADDRLSGDDRIPVRDDGRAANDRSDAPDDGRPEHYADDAARRHDDARDERPAHEAPTDRADRDQGHEAASRDDNGEGGQQRGATDGDENSAAQASGDTGTSDPSDSGKPSHGANANAAAQAANAAPQTDQLLAGLAGAAHATTAQTAGAEQGADKVTATVQREISVAGPAAEAVTSGRQGQTGGQHGANANGQQQREQHAQADIGPQKSAEQKLQATTKATANIAAQAAGIAKAIGEGDGAKVNVSVTQESAKLTSQPGSNLSAASAAQSEQQNASARAGAQNNHAQPGQATAASAQANAGPNATAQQAASQQGQAKGLQSAGAEAKGPVLQSVHATGAQGTTPLGAEQAQVGGSNAQNQTQQSQQTNAPHAAQQPRFQLPGQHISDQITVQITKAVAAGSDKISVQLHPADLGRVDVQLEMAGDGRVTAVVTADNKNTLEMLRQDGRELQRALQEAGLQAEAGDLSFNLRGENPARDGNADSGGQQAAADDAGAQVAADQPPEMTEQELRDYVARGRIDIKA